MVQHRLLPRAVQQAEGRDAIRASAYRLPGKAAS